VIHKAEIKPDEVRIVCSKSRENKRKNQEKLGAEYPIAESLDPIKRFNFYTSTCFEGCDIYDEKGVTIIVNDGKVTHTLIDVGTLFTQIAGRIRNSEYNKRGIMQIYSTTKSKEELTVEEYTRSVEKAFEEAKKFADRNNATMNKEDMKDFETKRRYTRIENEQIIIDRNLVVSDIQSYQLRNFSYSTYSIVMNNLTDNNFKITNSG